jgi:hypothetical protein
MVKDSAPILRLVLLAAAALVVAMLLRRLRGTRKQADQTADEIEDQLDSLDPATRTATVARLTHDAVKSVRDKVKS